ncbi:glycoprotein [Kitasatospora sp. NBC_01302]|uniref:glycoprotein n=1 Tax=Kitasatospora sp. NBC_01302 TaxID=2903575 RepID=UPI002E0E19EC|nr:glycoprotein [Kitasatospora sp. NBC_01302]
MSGPHRSPGEPQALESWLGLDPAEPPEPAAPDRGARPGADAAASAGPLVVPAPPRPYDERIATAREARLTAAPVNLHSEHEQARFELGLVVALVLDAPEAASGLDLLVNSQQIQPEGAEVFAALLYATGRIDGAEFWWRFAAGSGSRISAYCLHLHHLHLGELSDADYWQAWSRDLAERAELAEASPPPRPLRSSQPLLPDAVRRDILARCHRGLAPQLPPALAAVIEQLPVKMDEFDLREIPQPDSLGPGTLTPDPPAAAEHRPGRARP